MNHFSFVDGIGVVVTETGEELPATRAVMVGDKAKDCRWIVGTNRSPKSARFFMCGADASGQPTTPQVFSGPPASVVKKLNAAIAEFLG